MFDRTGLSVAQLGVSPIVLFISSLLNGENSILTIQQSVNEKCDSEPPSCHEIEAVIDTLDEAYFLEGPRFDDYYQQLVRDFDQQPVRPATSSGSAYSADSDQLARELRQMTDAAPPPEEPGLAVYGSRAAPRGVIVPHIDFVRGAAGYGQIYRELQEREPPDVVVILGVSHYPMQNRIAVCAKDFAVPGGAVTCARDFTDELLEACAGVADLSIDAFGHRMEHSVELQAVWLRHIWGDAISIVPVLVGSMAEFVAEGGDVSSAATDAQIATFVSAIGGIGQKHGRVMLLASADLSHVGPRFEDEREISNWFLEEVEREDRKYLEAVQRGDAVKGLATLAHHHDRYRVCGVGCIFALGAALPGVRGRLLGYHQAAQPELQQAVTFAAMMFE